MFSLSLDFILFKILLFTIFSEHKILSTFSWNQIESRSLELRVTLNPLRV